MHISSCQRLPYKGHNGRSSEIYCALFEFIKQALSEEAVAAILEKAAGQSFGSDLPPLFLPQAADQTPAPAKKTRRVKAAADSETSSDSSSDSDEEEAQHVSPS